MKMGNKASTEAGPSITTVKKKSASPRRSNQKSSTAARKAEAEGDISAAMAKRADKKEQITTGAENKQKAINSVLATLVGDAASMPVHWIYKDNDMEAALDDAITAPEFHAALACPYYNSTDYEGHYGEGQLSPYGEQIIVVLEFLSSNKVGMDAEEYGKYLYNWAKKYNGRLDHATKELLANGKVVAGEENDEDRKKFDEDDKNKTRDQLKSFKDIGSPDLQANCFGKVAIIAAKYAGRVDYLEKVEIAVRGHQDHDGTVAFAIAHALLLEKILLTGSIDEGFKAIQEHFSADTYNDVSESQVLQYTNKAITDGEAAASDNYDIDYDSIKTYMRDLSVELNPGVEGPFKFMAAKSCGFPQAYIVSIKIIAQVNSIAKKNGGITKDSFKFGVRANILSGGDNCGRNPFVTSVIAAAGSIVIPEDWLEKTKDNEMITEMASVLVQEI